MESFIENNTLPLLTEAQRRTLSVSLQLLEEELFFIQLIAGNGKYKGELFFLEVDLDKEQLRRLDEVIKKILSRIHYLKEKFNLNGRTKRLSRHIHGVESYSWTVLSDKKTVKLKAYGTVSEELPGVLDPLLDQIMEELRKMVKF